MFNEEETLQSPDSSPESKLLESKLLEARSIFVFGEITQQLAEKVCSQLLLLHQLNNEPIKLFINSQGGHVEAGDSIHDMIRFITPKVQMIGTGWVASAGVTIYLSVPKEQRYSLPNTRYMIHQVAGGVRGMTTEIEIETREMLRVHQRLNRLISDATGQPFEKVVEDTDRNYWLSNQDAVDYGIVGQIIQNIDELNPY